MLIMILTITFAGSFKRRYRRAPVPNQPYADSRPSHTHPPTVPPPRSRTPPEAPPPHRAPQQASPPSRQHQQASPPSRAPQQTSPPRQAPQEASPPRRAPQQPSPPARPRQEPQAEQAPPPRQVLRPTMASVAEEGNRIEAATPGDHYSTLGLDINARLDEVKEVHKKLARMMHPDKAEKLIGREKANNVQAKINAAYEVLGTETRKAEYDKFRAMAFSP